MDWSALLGIAVSLLLIGFFSGIEIAFVSANKLSLELRRKQGTYAGKVWGEYADKPAKFIGTSLICINIVLVMYGLLVSGFMDWLIWSRFKVTDAYYLKLAIDTLLSTVLLLLVEFVFKAIFRAKNDGVLRTGSLPISSSSFTAYCHGSPAFL